MRTRNVKPALFKNEVLGAHEPIVTLLFIGLWCLADREGRLEDRPLKIRNELFPQRNVDVDAALGWLNEQKFIKRYAIGETKYLQILAFKKHQHIHSNEAPSEIPGPPLRENSGNSSTSAVIPSYSLESCSLVAGESSSLDEGVTALLPDPRTEMALITAPIEGLNLVAWQSFVDYRKRIRKPIRELSYPLAMKSLVGFGDDAMQLAVVNQTIANGWQGLFELKRKVRGVERKRLTAEDIKNG